MKILKGAGIAGAGAAAIYGIEGVAALNFSIWTPAVTALAAIMVNIVRQWLTNATPKNT